MATEEKDNSYEGFGTGGKFRKRPIRRTQTTPYHRPSTSLRNPTRNNNNGWLSKVVDPAHRLITYTAQTLSVPFGASASPSFGLTGNTAFSSGNSLFPSPPATNAACSFESSSFPSSSSATNMFNSGTTFGLGSSASSSAVNSLSSNSGTNSALFGSSSWQPSKSSPFGSTFNSSSSSSGFSFGKTTASVASTSSPTMFSSTPQFSFTSAAATAPTQPAFGNPNSVFTFGSAPVNNDQMTMEDSMAEDTVQATPPATPVFGQQPTPVQSNFLFGASTPSGASPFQFGSQQNTTPPNPSLFQASGSLEFSDGGGSFSLGTGGGDKSGRRIVKVKNRHRKR